ncbi:S8 family serine peptidase [Agromyces archimandritae]|uniref:S8 family serine peptidase n=1 Tax=Agromyces archimandritae TaxID=2781962 RepID=UPI001FD1607D|nr:S8 family serine peptidase [Agromyces archimandritae]
MNTFRRGRPGAAGLHGIAAATLSGAVFVSAAVVGFAAPASAEEAAPAAAVDFADGRYIVVLDEQPAAVYEGGVAGFEATAPAPEEQLDAQAAPVEKYTDYLAAQQEDVAGAVGADVSASYTLTLNAFAANLDAEQAAGLARDKRVQTLVPDELLHTTATPSTEFLGLEGEGGVWESIGGVEQAGEGVVVGVLDTGIAPENPSFAGEPLGTEPGADPYLDGDSIVFEKADGNTFTGVCVEGEQFAADDCSTKIVGARYFVDGFGEDRLGGVELGEYVSPRDGDGHGSHTASTAAGNNGVPAAISGVDYGTISGVAPAAKVAMYKVCWTGPDPTVTTDDGCSMTDILAAIDAAVSDGVDVINYSIGGGGATSTIELSDQAYFNAAAAGVFVSASAGNDGPTASTVDNAAPWITTVAASTIPSYEATATFGDGTAVAGASITVDRTLEEPLSGELVRADLAKLDTFEDAADALLCAPGSLDPAKATGKIVLCERGVYDRVAKSAEVARAGGIGTLLVNSTPGSIDTDEHSVPTIHLEDRYWDVAYAYAATEGATATFTPDNTTDYTPPTPQVAGFSSRGPIVVDGSNLLKPDIAAPGVAILADGPNAEGAEPTFMFASGTSMAAPHIAGLAALYLGERPNATPAEIKSAMMTTAGDTVDGDGARVTDPFAQGAGQVDPTRFFDAGLLYLNGPEDWARYVQGIDPTTFPELEPITGTELNLASIAIGSLTAPQTVTRTVTSTAAGDYTVSVEGLEGIEATVTPSTLSFGAAGETASYQVSFERTTAAVDAYATGSLTWADGTHTVRSPIVVQPVALSAPDAVSGEGVDGQVAVEVVPGSDGEIPLATSGLTAGTLHPNPDDPEAGDSGSGTAGDEFRYDVTIGEGVEFARFDLDAADDTSDLDLFVYRLNAAGQAVALYQSATASADERVDLPAPPAATYAVFVDVYSGATAWDFTTFEVTPGAGEGSFQTDPAALTTTQGEPVSYTANWSGLTPETDYLGIVHYGDTGRSTLVEVASGAAAEPGAPVNTVAPAIEGTPAVGSKLTATPGQWTPEGLSFAYQWKADGVDIPGAKQAKLQVTKKLAGASLSVVVTASAEGLPSASAESAAVVIAHTAKLDLKLSTPIAFSWNTVKATVSLSSSGDVAGQQVTVSVNGTEVPVVVDAKGKASVKLPKLGSGLHGVTASFAGTDTVAAAKSHTKYLLVLF